jgi:hypothetical protein
MIARIIQMTPPRMDYDGVLNRIQTLREQQEYLQGGLPDLP